jgi:hypothetical protein
MLLKWATWFGGCNPSCGHRKRLGVDTAGQQYGDESKQNERDPPTGVVTDFMRLLYSRAVSNSIVVIRRLHSLTLEMGFECNRDLSPIDA